MPNPNVVTVNAEGKFGTRFVTLRISTYVQNGF